MGIEQVVTDAIADFHDFIADGWEIQAAVEEASMANGLKPGVLEHRLSKAMPIDELVRRIRAETGRKHTHEIIYNVIIEYVGDGGKNWFKPLEQRRQERMARLEAALGHPLSSEEVAQAEAAERKVREEISIKSQREFARALRKAEPKTDVED